MLYPFFSENTAPRVRRNGILLKLKTIKITHLIRLLPAGKTNFFLCFVVTAEGKSYLSQNEKYFVGGNNSNVFSHIFSLTKNANIKMLMTKCCTKYNKCFHAQNVFKCNNNC